MKHVRTPAHPPLAVHIAGRQAARRHPRTIYKLVDQGEFPGYRFGRVLRLKAGDVEAYIETCRIEPGTIGHLYPHHKR